ncbi:46 kDa FK506-binding nuclear protein [Sesamum indicum]|uniref:46 kDa FK506-binding nuclear protein n=1 Tax=Sesamum indicum TaxID=4182 RepID=A0A6I9SL17_SESIN|nr:46 kDa FK506-binding nuclear protein [Sesamum indicum]
MSNPGKKATVDDEVEQLLRAAQDDVLLKLNVNSHMARASASAAIDPDLDRRFQALRKSQKPTKLDDSTKRSPPKVERGDGKVDGAAAEDDLFARFAALKNSLPSYNKNERKSPADVSGNELATEEESEDEVDKVIKWAIDSARLDPSPPSDDDDDDDDNDRSDEDDDVDDDDGVKNGTKGKRK